MYSKHVCCMASNPELFYIYSEPSVTPQIFPKMEFIYRKLSGQLLFVHYRQWNLIQKKLNEESILRSKNSGTLLIWLPMVSETLAVLMGWLKSWNLNQHRQYEQWKDEHNWFERPYKQGKISKDNTHWDFRIWLLIIYHGCVESTHGLLLTVTKDWSLYILHKLTTQVRQNKLVHEVKILLNR